MSILVTYTSISIYEEKKHHNFRGIGFRVVPFLAL
jgi:hypothetical protein